MKHEDYFKGEISQKPLWPIEGNLGCTRALKFSFFIDPFYISKKVIDNILPIKSLIDYSVNLYNPSSLFCWFLEVLSPSKVFLNETKWNRQPPQHSYLSQAVCAPALPERATVRLGPLVYPLISWSLPQPRALSQNI
jgi:hypothetical protein